MARRAASAPMSDTDSFSPAILRSFIPLLVKIHSSDVSTILESSVLVSTRLGVYEPVPSIIVDGDDIGVPSEVIKPQTLVE